MGGHENSHQQVEVFVNGESAGQWLAPTSNIDHRWIEDSFHLPAQLTRGRTKLEIELVPADDAPAWSAALYKVFNIVPRSAQNN